MYYFEFHFQNKKRVLFKFPELCFLNSHTWEFDCILKLSWCPCDTIVIPPLKKNVEKRKILLQLDTNRRLYSTTNLIIPSGSLRKKIMKWFSVHGWMIECKDRRNNQITYWNGCEIHYLLEWFSYFLFRHRQIIQIKGTSLTGTKNRLINKC